MPVSETTEEKKDDGERTTVVTGCVIRDNYQGDDYYAKVTVRRRRPIRQTIQRDGRVELADIFTFLGLRVIRRPSFESRLQAEKRNSLSG
jgi:hypothetical protein